MSFFSSVAFGKVKKTCISYLRSCFNPKLQDAFDALRKKLQFHLMSWCGNFVKRHSFRIVLGNSPKTKQKLCLSTKFSNQEIRWNQGIFCSDGLHDKWTQFFKFWSILSVSYFVSVTWNSEATYCIICQTKFDTNDFFSSCESNLNYTYRRLCGLCCFHFKDETLAPFSNHSNEGNILNALYILVPLIL